MDTKGACKAKETIRVERSEKAEVPPEKDPLKHEIAAIVPLRTHASATVDMNETLVRRCAESIRESAYVKSVVISADDPELVKMAGGFKNARSVLRPETLSRNSVRVSDVLQYTLGELNLEGYEPDIILSADITYPFRPPGIFDRVIEMLLSGCFDTVFAGTAEYRVCWKKENDSFKCVTDLATPRPERTPLHIGLPSLACAVYPDIVKRGLRYGENIGIYEIEDPFAAIEVRTPGQLESVARQLYWPE